MIDKIRSALEFARTRTPAGGPVSSQAEAGLMAIAEVEREWKRMADEIAIHGKMADSMTAKLSAARAMLERVEPVMACYAWRAHTELRAFLEPVTHGEVAYTFGDAPIDHTKPHHFEAVGAEFPNTCRRCACFRESVNHTTR